MSSQITMGARRKVIPRLRVFALLLLGACHGSEGARAAPPSSSTEAIATTSAVSGHDEAAPGDSHDEPAEPVLVVADQDVLAALEAKGFDAGTTITGTPARTTAELAKQGAYRTLADTVGRDLARDRRSDLMLGVGMRHAHRQLDAKWLDSERTRFDLIAVVNRLDRRVFNRVHCGEVRLVYRLAYRADTKTGPLDSRLPMTVNAVFFTEPDAHGSCTATARSWLRPEHGGHEAHGGQGDAAWLVGEAGPLSPSRRAAWRRKSVELNFQSVRWPSTMRPSMAGHAEYVLRAFRPIARAPFFEPMPLENTIDVARLRANRKLSEELTTWIKKAENIRAIDAGEAVVPEVFLATRSVSVSPHGLARRNNRPFRSVLEPSAFAGVDLSGTRTIRSPAALLRRLDALSCPGCHQSRSIAGFHLLGVEPAADRADSIEVPMSIHFHAELAFRREFVRALASGTDPDEPRFLPERAPGDDGLGAHCGLGDAGFSDWTCASGLRCRRGADDEVGECVPAVDQKIGDPCEAGRVVPSIDGRRDTVNLDAPASCGRGRVCEVNSVGFPGGMCAGGCESLPAGATCGGIPLLADFNACLAAGTSFDRCLAENTRPAALRACSFKSPCRDDYVCARGAEGGVCMPPYFLFQLRVDGHAL